MWIPTPIYERIPQFWLLLGLLFISSGTYLGFEYRAAFVYFSFGFACCVWSLWIFTMRLSHRQVPEEMQAPQDAPAQQTEQQSGDDQQAGIGSVA